MEKIEAVEDNYLDAKEMTLRYAENIQSNMNGILCEISRLKRTLEDFEAYLKEREDEDASEEEQNESSDARKSQPQEELNLFDDEA